LFVFSQARRGVDDLINCPDFGTCCAMPPGLLELFLDCKRERISFPRQKVEHSPLTAFVIVVVFWHFNDDWCHTQGPVMTRLTHDECTAPWSGAARNAAPHSPSTRRPVNSCPKKGIKKTCCLCLFEQCLPATPLPSTNTGSRQPGVWQAGP